MPDDIPAGFFISTDTNNRIAAAPAIGFSSAAGAAVTQASTSGKATAVTINAKSGVITLNNASMTANATVLFTVTNSAIGPTDVVITGCGSGTGGGAGTAGAYQVHCISCAPGSAVFRITNVSAGTLSEAVAVNFAVIDCGVSS